MTKLRRREETVYIDTAASSVTRHLSYHTCAVITTCLGRGTMGEGVAHPRRSVFQYTFARGKRGGGGRGWKVGAKGADRVCGINPGRIIRRRGELKLPYASASWINSPETFIHFNALLCRHVARNVICTIDCGAVYTPVINVAIAPMDKRLKLNINVAFAPPSPPPPPRFFSRS